MREKTPRARGARLIDRPPPRRSLALPEHPTRPAAAALERPTPTARRLAEASLSPNTHEEPPETRFSGLGWLTADLPQSHG